MIGRLRCGAVEIGTESQGLRIRLAQLASNWALSLDRSVLEIWGRARCYPMGETEVGLQIVKCDFAGWQVRSGVDGPQSCLTLGGTGGRRMHGLGSRQSGRGISFEVVCRPRRYGFRPAR